MYLSILLTILLASPFLAMPARNLTGSNLTTLAVRSLAIPATTPTTPESLAAPEDVIVDEYLFSLTLEQFIKKHVARDPPSLD